MVYAANKLTKTHFIIIDVTGSVSIGFG